MMHGAGLCDGWPLIAYPDHAASGAVDYPLEPGIVLRVEALVLPEGGDFSTKVEDQVLVTEDGHETLSRHPFDAALMGTAQGAAATGGGGPAAPSAGRFRAARPSARAPRAGPRPPPANVGGSLRRHGGRRRDVQRALRPEGQGGAPFAAPASASPPAHPLDGP